MKDRNLREVLSGNLEGQDGWGVQKEWYICIYTDEPFYCTTETNTIIIIVNHCCSLRGCKESDTTEQLS